MRGFVVIGHTASLDPGFSLDDLAGSAGRMDVLCRCVNAGLLLSHGVRTDARVWLVIQDELAIRFDGAALRNVGPAERVIGGLIRKALEAKANAIGAQWVESSPGICVSRRDLDTVLDAASGPIVQLHEDGDPLPSLPAEIADPVFVLSDHQDFTSAEDAVIAPEYRISVGPRRLHADHTMSIVHNYLDTAGYTQYDA